jgi:NDP-sugar pyrophosphorylase family protein
MKKKYEFTEITVNDAGFIMHQIRALKDFDDVKAGDLGGFIRDESNLSHKGNCWVYPGSFIGNKARVTGNAKVKGGSVVRNTARVYENAVIDNGADIYTAARIHGNAYVGGQLEVNRSEICGDAHVEGHGIGCHISGQTVIRDNAHVYLEEMSIYGKIIKGDERVVKIKSHKETMEAIAKL